ncbi:hypothetical protein [Puniceibacterium antarcticum]|uniref:hypothetical protein n=1 Tax=Puniceibacterium antarcticum TaxID=1206336 RepID=UPI003CCBE4F7
MDDPARLRSDCTVGACLGLTPKRYQSGLLQWSCPRSQQHAAATLKIHLSQLFRSPEPHLFRKWPFGRLHRSPRATSFPETSVWSWSRISARTCP